MIYKDKVDIYTKKRVPDGFGGHIEKEIFKENIECKITTMTTQKQNMYFGNMSMTALSIITTNRVGNGDIIKINNRDYEVIRVSRALNKYIIDAEVMDV